MTVANGTSTAHLVFYRQHAQTAVTALDPAQNYLRLERTVHGVKQSGSNYTADAHPGR